MNPRFRKVIYAFAAMLVCLATCRGECPQTTFESATVQVCADGCLSAVSIRGCIEPETVLENTRTVVIVTKTAVWRRGAIHDLPELTYVAASSAGISRISPGAFLNLPKLKDIKLMFSDIEEIQYGVFSNSSLEDIDLSWNIISYVENEAFSNMPNLRFLNLYENRIKVIYQSWFKHSYGLEGLVLSYNQLEKIHAFTFSVFHNMEYLDLSFNKIKEIGGLAFNNIRSLKRLDLTSNRLSWIPTNAFRKPTEVKELRLPLNRLSFLSTLVLDGGNVRSLALHPNPWQCPCLDAILKWMREHNATLMEPNDDFRIKYDSSLPDCSFNSKSRDKCVVGYDDDFLKAQEIFFREVNYTDAVRQQPTSERPNFDILPTDKPFSEDLSPLA